MISPAHRALRTAMGVLTWVLCLNAVHASEPFVFHHENVMGTSLELRVLADSEGAARRAEDQRPPGDRSALGDLQRIRPE